MSDCQSVSSMIVSQWLSDKYLYTYGQWLYVSQFMSNKSFNICNKTKLYIINSLSNFINIYNINNKKISWIHTHTHLYRVRWLGSTQWKRFHSAAEVTLESVQLAWAGFHQGTSQSGMVAKWVAKLSWILKPIIDWWNILWIIMVQVPLNKFVQRIFIQLRIGLKTQLH